MKNPISWHYANGLFWIRFWGKGFHAKDIKRHPKLFSERMGKGFTIGGIHFKLLK